MATAQLTPIGVGIHNVLIATDFSRYSNAALSFGLQLAKKYRASAHIVYVVPTEPYMLAGPDAYVAARDAAGVDLERLRAQLQQTHGYLERDDYQLYLLEGEIADSILDFAKRKQVDLVVVGTHGRSGLGKAILGSVAEWVFRHASVPVLTLGPGICTWSSDLQRILVAADFTPASRRAVRFAVGLAREHKAQLTLLHVVDPAQLQRVPDRAAVEHGIERRLAELLGPEAQGMNCSTRLEVGRVTRTILEVARQESADLLVLGVRPSSGVLDRLIIPHAYEVVRDSPCPVMTLRQPGAATN